MKIHNVIVVAEDRAKIQPIYTFDLTYCPNMDK